MHFPHTILIATDFSSHATAAFHHAVELASHFGAHLHIVNVVHDPLPVVGPFDVPVPETGTSAARADAFERMRVLDEKAAANGLQVDTHLLVGPVPAEITELAKRIDADWIVVGTRGHQGLKHLFLGSVAEQVVRGASCTVVVVREEFRTAALAEAPLFAAHSAALSDAVSDAVWATTANFAPA